MKVRSTLLFVGAWAALFAATVGIRSLHTSDRDDVDPLSEEQLTKLELQSIPPRTDAIPIEELYNDDSILFDNIHESIRNEKDKFNKCAVNAMSKSARKTEYFDVSFVVRSNPLGQFFLEEVAIDRSTLAFRVEDEDCIFRNLDGLRVDLKSAPSERIRFSLCFNKNGS